MKQYLINKKSDNLILFFTGWGCDEYEFEHLNSKNNVLLLYDYTDLNMDFNFSKYKNIDLIAFSAGVFTASILDLPIKINKKVALSGNPYLFDEHYGLSKDIQNLLCNITVENADDFARNYLVKTEQEIIKFHHSKRSIESCQKEFECLKNLYNLHKNKIKNIYDSAIMGENDVLFNISAQKEFYSDKLRIISNARHNLFFRIKNYEDILSITQ
ncbi:DUF452 family protein [bacterium]|nr:DUF452 family protein [bacterium]